MNHFKKLIKLVVLTAVFVFSVANAATPNPVDMLQNVSNQMVAGLKANKATLKTNKKLVYKLVRKNLLPHVDIGYMSRAVLGRSGWMSASSSERKAFTSEFINVVIKTYAAALRSYANEFIKFYPVRGGYEGRRFLTVNSVIIREGNQNVPMSYKLSLHGNKWLVNDLTVEGVSIISSFGSQFRSMLRSGKTVSDIVKDLKARREQ